MGVLGNTDGRRYSLSYLGITGGSYSGYSVALTLSFVNGGPPLAFPGKSLSGGGRQLRDVNRVEQHFRIWVVSMVGDEIQLRHPKSSMAFLSAPNCHTPHWDSQQ